MQITLERYPAAEDWMLCKACALVTVGKKPINPPDMDWKHDILKARHSPIRVLQFLFRLEGIPYFASVHLCRHVHAQPFVKSQRNDRQSDYDRNKAPQDAPVEMLWLMNADELLNVAEKRLCNLADPTTRGIVREMCKLVEAECPEFRGLLGPRCTHGDCMEMHGCIGASPFCAYCKHLGSNLTCRNGFETLRSCTCAFWELSPAWNHPED